MDRSKIQDLLTRPNFMHLPLGPLAGKTLHYARTPFGSTLHGSHRCEQTGKETAAITEFPQPLAGTLGDLNIPLTAHCHFDEQTSAYIHTAAQIAEALDMNDAAVRSWSEGGVPLMLFHAATMTDDDAPSDPALTEIWQQARTARAHLIGRLVSEHSTRTERAVELSSTARWLKSGRRPGKYEPQYEMFLQAARDALDLFGMASTFYLRDVADEFLDHVATGDSLRTTTARFLAEHEEPVAPEQPVPSPSQVVAHTWIAILTAMTAPSPPPALALLNFEPSYWTEPALHEIFLSLWGGARFTGGGVDWVLCPIPGTHLLHLRDTPFIRSGKIISRCVRGEPRDWANILRNIVSIEAGRKLAETVIAIEPGTLPFLPQLRPLELPAPPTQLRGKEGAVLPLARIPQATIDAAKSGRLSAR
jgi:hypothetical protein